MSPLVQKISLVVLLLIWLSPNASASVIKLNSGKTIEREITFRDDEMIKVDSGYDIDITYYFDEIESIDGQSPFTIEAQPAIDMPIKEPESIEVIEIVDDVDFVEDIKFDNEVEILEPIVINEDIEDTQPFEEEKPIVEFEPVKDISIIEEQMQIKELPSPFGPTIRENNTTVKNDPPTALKFDEPLPKAQIMEEQHAIGVADKKSMSDNVVFTVEHFIEKQRNSFHKYKIRIQRQNTFIQKKLLEIPVKIRKDILAVLSLVFIFVYVVVCFPLMLIANRLKRKYAWLALIPFVQIFYFPYIAKKPLWWGAYFLIPIANIIIMLVFLILILREMKKSYWLIVPALIPGINIIVIWYLALSKIRSG